MILTTHKIDAHPAPSLLHRAAICYTSLLKIGSWRNFRLITAPQPGSPPAARPLPPGTYHLTTRIFAGLFTDYDLHNVTSGYIAIPKGTPMFTGASLGDVARQISTASGYEHPDPADR